MSPAVFNERSPMEVRVFSAVTRMKQGWFLATLVALMAAFSFGATGASAATGSCPGTFVYPFASFGDTNPYLPVPGGDFEGSSAWTFSGGAAIGSGNESFFVHGKTDSHSLSLPAGSSATTPASCVTLVTPTLRFFAVGGKGKSVLNVDAIVTVAGQTVTQTVARIPASSSWAPTPTIFFYANLAALSSADLTTTVKFRFWPSDKTAWKIDDLYLDPRKSN
jgi:hypothetical protein